VTSKEPTLAEKKRSKKKPAGEEKEQLAADPEPSDTASQAAADADGREADTGAATEQFEEPVDINAVVVEDEVAEPDEELIEAGAEKAKRPSAKEVLNRLLEKNELILKLTKDNTDKEKKLKDLNEKWLRAVAEFENYRKRSRKEWELLKQQSKTEVILEILDVVDDFERAFSVTEGKDDEFVQGVRLIYNNLAGVLEKFGVQEIVSLNNSFDPNFHMAVGQLETENVESGHVAEVIQKGYRLDDTVIRPARVLVAK
jgi:molecular chaperone GrpE